MLKKKIKTADLLAFLDNEIKQYEAQAEHLCIQLAVVEKGDNILLRDKLDSRWRTLEHTTGALIALKQRIIIDLATEGN